MRVPIRYVKESDIADAVQAAARDLAPEVVRIRYNIGEDWTGDPAIFFRVLLSDEASKEEGLLGVMERVESRLVDELKPRDLGLFTYFNFRSKSEQDDLKEESWS